jgi:hypothetical protein
MNGKIPAKSASETLIDPTGKMPSIGLAKFQWTGQQKYQQQGRAKYL